MVVDARASGCNIVCSSTGGTKEIAGKSAVIIEEDEWNFEPIALYKPPKMDFTKKTSCGLESGIDMKICALKYYNILKDISK